MSFQLCFFENKTKPLKKKFCVFVDLPVDIWGFWWGSEHCQFWCTSLENIFFSLLPNMKRYFPLLTDEWVIYYNYIIFSCRGRESILLLWDACFFLKMYFFCKIHHTIIFGYKSLSLLNYDIYAFWKQLKSYRLYNQGVCAF